MTEESRKLQWHAMENPPNDLVSSRWPGRNVSAANLSMRPATKTTVVTTTTTTTLSFPPLVMRAPRKLKRRDPEWYPLAARPTPAGLRRIQFDVGGEVAQFVEADDVDKSLQEYASGLNRARKFLPPFVPTAQPDSNQVPESVVRPAPSFAELEALRHQSATPISLSDAGAGDEDQPERFYEARNLPSSPKGNVEESEAEDDEDKGSTTDQVERPLPQSLPYELVGDSIAFERRRDTIDRGYRGGGASMPYTRSATPPTHEDNDQMPLAPRPRAPREINTSSNQAVSLPSPSLSPITAAAQMRPSISLRNRLVGATVEPPSTDNSAMRPPSLVEAVDDTRLVKASINDVPGMLDSFDAMPENLQAFVLYQMLRRCAKPTLVSASRAIAAVLQVDFFKRLPLELSQHIVRLLDRKTLCRAAQVSKKWRQVVDGDEKAWMVLLKADGFRLSPGEVDRAVKEGWGWQFPQATSTLDRDLSTIRTRAQRSEEAVDSRSNLKRKRDSGSPHGSKRFKRRGDPKRESESAPIGKAAELGPNSFASMAAAAVPNPSVGLRSLRQLHLFKSIYRRHHIMRQSWLDPGTKPKHIAFKAHEGHVVTCLQFDSEKILTGSDDAIIDIYDTATGARLKRLEGHEGGVWALEYQDNMLVSGSTDRSVRIWDMNTGKCLHVFQGHTSTVRCLQIVQPVCMGTYANGKPIMMPPQRLIITGSRDSNCRIWKLPKMGDRSVFQAGPSSVVDADNPYFVRALTGHSHSVRAIAAHADTLVSGSYDGTVRVWQISTGETVHRLTGHTTKVYSVVLDYDRKRCISGSMDTIVKVWSIETGECLFNLSGHQSLVGLLDLKDDILVSAAADFTLKVWDPETGHIRHTLKAHTGAITCFAHDGNKVISGSERTLKMWDIRTGKYVKDLLTDLRGVWQVRFDERRCVAAVHRDEWTFIEILDFGAAWERTPESELGRRIVVDAKGREVMNVEELDLDDDDDDDDGDNDEEDDDFEDDDDDGEDTPVDGSDGETGDGQ